MAWSIVLCVNTLPCHASPWPTAVVSLIVVVTVMTILKKCCKLLSALMCHWVSELLCDSDIVVFCQRDYNISTSSSSFVAASPWKSPKYLDRWR